MTLFKKILTFLYINLPYGYVIDKSMKSRISQDTKVNTLGKYLVDMCISCRLRFLNGRHKGDYWGKFTCLRMQCS